MTYQKNLIPISPEEVGQAISELSRELSTNQIAPFSQINSTKKTYIRREINKEKIGIVQNMDWTGLDWTVGLDSWTGQLDWTIGLDYWTGLRMGFFSIK